MNVGNTPGIEAAGVIWRLGVDIQTGRRGTARGHWRLDEPVIELSGFVNDTLLAIPSPEIELIDILSLI